MTTGVCLTSANGKFTFSIADLLPARLPEIQIPTFQDESSTSFSFADHIIEVIQLLSGNGIPEPWGQIVHVITFPILFPFQLVWRVVCILFGIDPPRRLSGAVG